MGVVHGCVQLMALCASVYTEWSVQPCNRIRLQQMLLNSTDDTVVHTMLMSYFVWWPTDSGTLQYLHTVLQEHNGEIAQWTHDLLHSVGIYHSVDHLMVCTAMVLHHPTWFPPLPPDGIVAAILQSHHHHHHSAAEEDLVAALPNLHGVVFWSDRPRTAAWRCLLRDNGPIGVTTATPR